MDEEIWKDICFIENGVKYDYRGLYQVSNLGRIKSLIGNEKILSHKISNTKRHEVRLCKNNVYKWFLVHRLVGHMFLPESYFDGAEINHKDENPNNNYVANLEWCNRKYNMNYGTRLDRFSISKSIPIVQLNEYMEIINIFIGAKDIKNKLGFDNSSIGKCCKGNKKYNNVGGYKWKYLSDISEEKLLNYIIKNKQVEVIRYEK